MMRIIEFFAGIGCVHEAFEQAGLDFEVVARAEISAQKNVCYEALWGNVLNLGDVTEIENVPQADLWHFSSPCQDLSVAGKRAGIHGARSGVCWTMIDLAAKMRPPIVISENVLPFLAAGISSGYFRAWSELGYCVRYIVLSPLDVGIPQSRRRVFVLFSHDVSSPAPVPCQEPSELYPYLFGEPTPELDRARFMDYGDLCYPRAWKSAHEKFAYRRSETLTFHIKNSWNYFSPSRSRGFATFTGEEGLRLQGFRAETVAKASKAIKQHTPWRQGAGDGLCAKLYAGLLRSIFTPAPVTAKSKPWKTMDQVEQLELFYDGDNRAHSHHISARQKKEPLEKFF